MRIFLIMLLVFSVTARMDAQDSVMHSSVDFVNEVIRKIETENSPRKRLLYGMSIIRSGIDAEPLYMLEVGKQLYETAKRMKDPVTEAVAWSFYGQGYRLTGNYIKALESHNKAVQIGENVEDKSVLAYTFNQIGHIYKDRDETDKALHYYWNSKYFAELGNNKLVQGYASMNLGAVYLNVDKFDSSLYYSLKAYQIFKTEDEIATLIRTEMSGDHKFADIDMYVVTVIGSAYSKQNKFEEAERYFWEARKPVKNTIPNRRYQHILLFSLAQHFQRKNMPDSMLHYARLSIGIIETSSFAYLSAKPAKLLSDYYEDINPDSTVKYLKLYLKSNEIINSTRVTQQLQMMSFEEERRREEIQQAERNYRNRIQVFILVAGLLTAGLFIIMMYRNNLQKQKVNAKLEQKTKGLEDALEKLSSTQAQLIQSEKMASLGELTAGIAHEIQNPLNFVNNFSEVSKELIDEMKEELAVGTEASIQSAVEIADDISQNLEKINHHGKRADAIVKGMLAHSRTSSGKKELTDLNALVDEYLRLAYHGLKAKDQSLQAAYSFRPDRSLPKVNVVPQEIGRVLLNLINNAFYAVDEKKKQQPDTYEPKVTVSTKKVMDKVEVIVMDNGNGIPQKVMDKIFQPFFTTKPTGQGTGLGLSLSYDIVKAHGGELKVETIEGAGSEFSILLTERI
jgi:two-component system, NtrC family, sensor kinase